MLKRLDILPTKMKILHFLFINSFEGRKLDFQQFGSVTGGCVDIVTQTSIGPSLFTSATGMRGIRKIIEGNLAN